MSLVDELIERGAEQTSRKYRTVFAPPRGESCADLLLRKHPEGYQRLLADMNSYFEDRARSLLQRVDREFSYELTEEEFAEFRAKVHGSTSTFRREGRTPCAGCGSLGHMHARGCSA